MDAAATAKALTAYAPAKRLLAKRHLINFAEEVKKGFVRYPVNDFIFGFLEEVAHGDNDRLIVSAPPRHGKSLGAAELLPAYYWGLHPTAKIIYSSFNLTLCKVQVENIRKTIESEAYKDIFPDIKLNVRKCNQLYLRNESGGEIYGIQCNGGLTGLGADLFIIDDPHKDLKEAYSKIIRRDIINWFGSVAFARLNPGGKMVIIQTRWHYNDLAGHILDTDKGYNKWTYINLPCIAEENDPLGRKPGELLCPERFDQEKIDEAKRSNSPMVFNCLYQGHPTVGNDSLINIDWFKRYQNRLLRSSFDLVVQSWDIASKDGEDNDFTAMQTWGVNANGIYLLNCFNKKMTYPDTRRAVENFYRLEDPDLVLIEDKGNGIPIIQSLRRETSIPVMAIVPKVSKLIRANGITGFIEGGSCFLPEDNDLFDITELEKEIREFPAGEHDDQIDAMSQALHYCIPFVVEAKKKQVRTVENKTRLLTREPCIWDM